MGMVGSFGANGLDFDDFAHPQQVDTDCTVNPFIHTTWEKGPDGKN